MSEGKLLPYFFYHMVMKLRPSLQKQHPCKPVPGHHVFKTALGHGDPVFFFGFWQKWQFQFYMRGKMMLQAVAIEIEILPWVYRTTSQVTQSFQRATDKGGWTSLRYGVCPINNESFWTAHDLENFKIPCQHIARTGCFLDNLVKDSRAAPDVALPGQSYPASCLETWWFFMAGSHSWGWTHVFNWLWGGVFKIDFQNLENYYRL